MLLVFVYAVVEKQIVFSMEFSMDLHVSLRWTDDLFTNSMPNNISRLFSVECLGKIVP